MNAPDVSRFISTFMLSLALGTAAVPACADIYQQVDADGVICFTDTPSTAGYSLLLRERKLAAAPPSSVKRKVPEHLSAIAAAANGIALTSTPNGTATTGGFLPVQGRVTSLTGVRNDPFDGKLRHHNGMDIACPSGTPIKPVARGMVIFSGTRPGYGKVVVVEHPDGTVTLYAHNSRNLVAAGESVEPTTVIAETGSSGRSTGSHLHFEAWLNGENITHSFLPTGTVATQQRRSSPELPIKRYLQPDGTLVFTNLAWK